MGASLDQAGLLPERTAAIPSFFATGGFGDGRLGLDFALFATTASGRFRTPDAPVDRLGVDAMLVIRPWGGGPLMEKPRWRRRVLRALAGEVGFGYEHDSRGLLAGSRMGARLGARAELPMTPWDDTSQLRLRLGIRRFIGFYVPRIGETAVGDTTFEAYAAVAVVF